jgi:hypothetical protein
MAEIEKERFYNKYKDEIALKNSRKYFEYHLLWNYSL